MRKLLYLKRNAFTLIEVMVAMVVLAIGLLGLAGITVVVLRSNTLSQQISEATTISADLMDTLKRQSVSSLTNCATANAYTPVSAAAASGCTILTQSGILGLGQTYMPALARNNSTCVVSGATILQSTVSPVPVNFDNVAANFYVFPDSTLGMTASTDICSLSSATLPPHSYIRYYRTYDGSTSSEHVIVVVVAFKDRFGVWRNVHLSTTKTN